MSNIKLKHFYQNKLVPILPYIFLVILMAIYVLFFSILSIDRHNRLQTLAFDLGINDQAIWQFSRFHTPFNTVRGIHIFGDHFALINAMTSPIYWFTDDVRMLLIFQSFIFAAGAIPLYLIARHYLNNKWLPLIFCFTYLLFPALQYVNLEDYHPESFIPLFLLFTFYFIIKKKMWPYLIFFFLTLSCKEEITLTTFLLGFYVYFKFDKKLGIFTSVFSLVWLLLVTRAFVPYFNGYGYLYSGHLLGNYGEKPLEIFLNFINPGKMIPIVFNATNGKFMWELFAPVGFLSLLNPTTLIMAAALWMNLITSWSYSHNIYYHHVIAIIPFVFISLVKGSSKFKEKKIIFYSMAIFLLASSLASNYYIAPFDSSVKNYEHTRDKIRDFRKPAEREIQLQSIIKKIPPNASVSASFMAVPHLSHRDKIYDFPNPFKSHYWGNWKEEPPLEYVDFLLLSKEHIVEFHSLLQPLIENKTYRVEVSFSDFTLFSRQK